MKKIIDKWQYYITNKHNKTKTKILFITLTISDTIKTKIDHKKLFKNYIEKIQYTVGKFNYISKIEFQENGNIHWHIMQDKEVRKGLVEVDIDDDNEIVEVKKQKASPKVTRWCITWNNPNIEEDELATKLQSNSSIKGGIFQLEVSVSVQRFYPNPLRNSSYSL